MYGLTEAFRSTFLPPQDVDSKPTAIGMAIPECEVFPVTKDGKRVQSLRDPWGAKKAQKKTVSGPTTPLEEDPWGAKKAQKKNRFWPHNPP